MQDGHRGRMGLGRRAKADTMSSIPHLLQFSSVSHLGSFVYNDVIVKWRQEGVGLCQTTSKPVPRLCVHHSTYVHTVMKHNR